MENPNGRISNIKVYEGTDETGTEVSFGNTTPQCNMQIEDGGNIMENATDALKMAAAVLMFLLALSVSIISFVILRQTSDVVMNYKDRETAYIEGNLYYETTGTERSVGLETILCKHFE